MMAAGSSKSTSGSTSSSHSSVASRDSRRERLTEYLASRRVDATKSSTITTSRPTSTYPSTAGISKVTVDRLNRTKISAPQPTAASSRHEKTDTFGESTYSAGPQRSTMEAKPTVPPTPTPKLSAHSTFSALRKSSKTHVPTEPPSAFPPPSPPSVPASSSSGGFDDDDSFGPMKLTFDSTPPRKPKSSQAPGLLSHFKAKKTPTGASAQKALSFHPPSFPHDENETEREFSTTTSSSSTASTTTTTTLHHTIPPSSHFKPHATPMKATAIASTSSHFKAPAAVAPSSHAYPTQDDIVHQVPSSHFKQPAQEVAPMSRAGVIDLMQKPQDIPNTSPPSNAKTTSNMLRKSPTVNLDSTTTTSSNSSTVAGTTTNNDDVPPWFKAAPVAMTTTTSITTSTDHPTPFPSRLQEAFRQLLDEAIYTSKFSLAGARVVFADIPTHLPLAPEKAIFWLAKANVEEQHKAWTTAAAMYTEALHVLSVPLERLIVEAAFMEFQRRLKLTSPSSPVNIVVPNMKTELTPEKQREFCAHLLEGGTHEDSFIMDDSTARWLH